MVTSYETSTRMNWVNMSWHALCLPSKSTQSTAACFIL